MPNLANVRALRFNSLYTYTSLNMVGRNKRPAPAKARQILGLAG